LFSFQFGTDGSAGANSSSTALLIAYGNDLEKILFTFLLAGVAVVIAILADIPGRGGILRLAVGIGLLGLLSQDFFAFQLWINSLVMLCVLIITIAMLAKFLRLASAPGPSEHGLPTMLPK
jgi:hypothetical protein